MSLYDNKWLLKQWQRDHIFTTNRLDKIKIYIIWRICLTKVTKLTKIIQRRMDRRSEEILTNSNEHGSLITEQTNIYLSILYLYYIGFTDLEKSLGNVYLTKCA